jgi:drug/metabolite transporter (DMT)-like permease
MKNNQKYILTLVAATFLMASAFIAGKVLLKTIAPFTLVGWRFFVAALATLPLVYLLEKEPLTIGSGPLSKKPRWGIIALIGLLQSAGTMGLLFLSMLYVSPSTAAILLFTNPLWVAILGYFFLDERLSSQKISGLILGILGVVLLIGLKEGFGQSFGELLGLGASLCWATSTIINRKYPTGIGTWRLSFWQMLIGSLALLVVAWVFQEPFPENVSGETLAWFLWLAIPASTGSFGLWFLALKNGGATQSSAFLFMAPLFTILLSAIIFQIMPTFTQVLGGLCVFMALFLVNFQFKKQPTL